MIKRSAFSMLELIFVIVVIGILSKFGIELLAGTYQNFLFTKINNKLQNQSATAVEFVAKRLSYRIKDSVIARVSSSDFDGLQGIDPTKAYTALEWVARDIDGFRGTTQPYWSGIADLDASTNAMINTPNTDVAKIDELIKILSQSGSDINDAAIYFIGSNSDVKVGYGWGGSFPATLTDRAIHPISSSTNNQFDGVFNNVDLYEYYQLSWTANAVVLENYDSLTRTYDLVFYYDYQPWLNEDYTQGKSSLIMHNVHTFQFRSLGSMIKVQVCVKSNLTNEEHSLCKEKTIF